MHAIAADWSTCFPVGLLSIHCLFHLSDMLQSFLFPLVLRPRDLRPRAGTRSYMSRRLRDSARHEALVGSAVVLSMRCSTPGLVEAFPTNLPAPRQFPPRYRNSTTRLFGILVGLPLLQGDSRPSGMSALLPVPFATLKSKTLTVWTGRLPPTLTTLHGFASSRETWPAGCPTFAQRRRSTTASRLSTVHCSPCRGMPQERSHHTALGCSSQALVCRPARVHRFSP